MSVDDSSHGSHDGSHHFVHCDVTSYESQRQLFRKALSLSTTHTLNTVIANAGVGMVTDFTELPETVDEDPPEPNLTTLDVNLTGVIYTAKLALHHFRRNSDDEDRHLLFIGSVASFASSPGLLGLYTASKHAVLGFFRCLYMYPGPHATGVRMNLLCPYFVATPILPRSALLLLSGLDLALCEDVVEAAARLTCLKRANGRCLVVAPRSSGGIQEMDAAIMHAVEPFSMRLVMALQSKDRAAALIRGLLIGPTRNLIVGVLVVGLVLALGWTALAKAFG